MFNFRHVLILGILTFFPFDFIHGASCIHRHSPQFELKDLKGTYVVTGITAGGPQVQSSNSLFTLKIIDDEGNGILPFFSSRISMGVVPSIYVRAPSEQIPYLPTAKVNLNPDGTGQLLIFDIPQLNDTNFLDIIFWKEDGKVVGGSALKVKVTGPSANSGSANEVKTFILQRQRE